MSPAIVNEPNVVPFIIDGADYYPKKVFNVVSPATGKTVHQSGAASVADANLAVDAAAAALKEWRLTTPSHRRDIFLRAAEIFERRRDELAQYAVNETGCTLEWAEHNIDVTADIVKDVAGRISAIEGSVPALRDANMSGVVLREPFGVVLAIAPWNAPYLLGARSVAFPVAAGNTVVMKATEIAPQTLRSIISVFQEAGLPKGVMNVIVHAPADAAVVTAALIANPHIKKINFTGSTNVGRIIGKLAGEQLKPVVLELGGKAPAIVWEDADLDLAAQQCAVGAFNNSGQICMSTERIIIHKNVKTEFQTKFKAAIESRHSSDDKGSGLTLINEGAVAKNKALVKDAISKGAAVIHGDVNAPQASKTKLSPIVLDKVTPDMDIYMNESFGPTVAFYEVETEEEALRIANDTEYGLTSAVFTEDLRRGLRFARGIESGAVHINSQTVHDEPALPHGGSKMSGYGRFNSSAGLEEWVRLKNVTFLN